MRRKFSIQTCFRVISTADTVRFYHKPATDRENSREVPFPKTQQRDRGEVRTHYCGCHERRSKILVHVANNFYSQVALSTAEMLWLEGSHRHKPQTLS